MKGAGMTKRTSLSIRNAPVSGKKQGDVLFLSGQEKEIPVILSLRSRMTAGMTNEGCGDK
jgi:hypothetical protein